MKKEEKKIEFTKKELQTIAQLLFAGKFGFSSKEDNQVVTPLINRISKMIDQLK